MFVSGNGEIKVNKDQMMVVNRIINENKSLTIIQPSSSSSSSSSRICLIALRFQLFIAFPERKQKVPFSMAIGNGELMHECFPKHLRMGTARMK